MTTNGLRWGFLGAGGIAHAQASDMKLHGFDLAAVGARDLAKAQEFADQFGFARAHGSYAELVADPDVDAIYVSTLHPLHAPHAKLALAAGKHVLVEKPFTMSGAEAREVVDLAAANGVAVLEAMWTRFLPHMVRIREILAQGLLGDVRTVMVDHDQKIGHIARLVRPELGGGAFLDLGIYPMSFAWDVLGAPSTVLAHSTPWETGVDAQTSVILGYETGAHAVLQTQLDAVGPNRATVNGTDGRIEIEWVWYNQTKFTRYDAENNVVERFDDIQPGRGMQYQAWELERIVASGAITGEILPPSETVQIMELMDRVRGIIGLEYGKTVADEA